MYIKSVAQHFEETREDRITELLQVYYQKIYLYCFSILRNVQDAEDAVQEVFIKAFQNKKLMEIENDNAWLYKIAYHHCLNKVKRQSIIKFISFDGGASIPQPTTEVYKDAELDDILTKLKPKERALISLRIIEDRDFTDIALILNISPATARKRFERIKAKIQKIIERGLQDEKSN